MANGRSANVRSHRRGRGRTPLWLGLGLVVVLAAGAGTVAWPRVFPKPCSGMETATVDAAPDIAPILDQLNTAWAATKPAVGGRCVAVDIQPKDSALMSVWLGSPWDPANGPAPDVWVPESSIWIQQASTSAVAQQLMPDLQPSLARSPNVIAMPEDEAKALGWPSPPKFDWPDVITDANTADYWTSLKQTYGQFKFTMTNPETSTAGMLTLMSIADSDNSGSVTLTDGAGSERPNIINLAKLLNKSALVGDVSDILTGLASADTRSAQAATGYVSAFPALEQDVIKYDETDPKEPLVAIYPTSGSFDADNPYLILNKPSWGNPQNVEAAKAFRDYIRTPAARTTFLKAGFRDANRNGDASFTATNGVEGSLADLTLPRSVIDPNSVRQTLLTWNAATQESNVLIVLDVSGSMDDVVAGANGQTRLQLAQTAASDAIDQFGGQSNVGLWEFATDLDGQKDYRTLVPLGALGDTMPDNLSRRDELKAQIQQLKGGGNTGLYNTVDAAQKAVSASFRTNARNFVVVITDGKNDPGSGATGTQTDLQELKLDLTHVKSSGKNVPVMTIGISAEADDADLQAIAATSGGVFFKSESGFDIDAILQQALFAAPDES
jgi:Ca-activated chloride channel family protein